MSDDDLRGCSFDVVGQTWEQLEVEALRIAEPFLGIPRENIRVTLTNVEPTQSRISGDGSLREVTLWTANASCSGRP